MPCGYCIWALSWKIRELILGNMECLLILEKKYLLSGEKNARGDVLISDLCTKHMSKNLLDVIVSRMLRRGLDEK